jgi:hypothetical protein
MSHRPPGVRHVELLAQVPDQPAQPTRAAEQPGLRRSERVHQRIDGPLQGGLEQLTLGPYEAVLFRWPRPSP